MWCVLVVLCIIMESSYNKLEIVHCTYLGVQVIIFKTSCILLSRDLFTITNSVDPDEMPH